MVRQVEAMWGDEISLDSYIAHNDDLSLHVSDAPSLAPDTTSYAALAAGDGGASGGR